MSKKIKYSDVNWSFVERWLPGYYHRGDVADSDDLQRFVDGEIEEEDLQSYIYDEYGKITEEEGQKLLEKQDIDLMVEAIESFEENTGLKWKKNLSDNEIAISEAVKEGMLSDRYKVEQKGGEIFITDKQDTTAIIDNDDIEYVPLRDAVKLYDEVQYGEKIDDYVSGSGIKLKDIYRSKFREGGSVEDKYTLEQYLEDYSSTKHGNPYGEGSGEYEVEVIDNEGSEFFYIWGEGEDEIRKDLLDKLAGDQAIEVKKYMRTGGEEKFNNPELLKVVNGINNGKLKILRGGSKKYGKLTLSIQELVWGRNLEDGFRIDVFDATDSHIGTIDLTASTNWKPEITEAYAKGGSVNNKNMIKELIPNPTNLDEFELDETDGVEYEIWQDKKTGQKWHIPIDREEDDESGEPNIYRHFSDATKFDSFRAGGLMPSMSKAPGLMSERNKAMKRLIMVQKIVIDIMEGLPESVLNQKMTYDEARSLGGELEDVLMASDLSDPEPDTWNILSGMEEFKVGGRVYKKGRAWHRDRLWKSQEPHEQNYKRKKMANKNYKRDKDLESQEPHEIANRKKKVSEFLKGK